VPKIYDTELAKFSMCQMNTSPPTTTTMRNTALSPATNNNYCCTSSETTDDKNRSFLFRTPRGKSIVANVSASASYDDFLQVLLEKAAVFDQQGQNNAEGIHGGGGDVQIGAAAAPIDSLGSMMMGTTSRRTCDAVCVGKMVGKVRSCVGVDVDGGGIDGVDGKSEEEDVDVKMKLQTDNTITTEERLANGRQSANVKSINYSEVAYVVHNGKVLGRNEYQHLTSSHSSASSSDTTSSKAFHHISLNLRLRGGMADRQNRVGSKFGGGGVSSGQQQERERKERLRQLALETVDLAKDPYLMRNHLGTYECKLCLTLHTNEGNYLAHTQGKKHQAGLAKRAAMEAKKNGSAADGVGPALPSSLFSSTSRNQAPRIKIGRPGYEISKSRHYQTNQRCLSFQLQFPEIESNAQPRHRFMSAFEQRVESPPDRSYQYLLVAAEPYETVAFKIPNETIDRGDGMFVTNWDVDKTTFTITLYFVDSSGEVGQRGPPTEFRTESNSK